MHAKTEKERAESREDLETILHQFQCRILTGLVNLFNGPIAKI
jgi:hypothetical protein